MTNPRDDKPIENNSSYVIRNRICITLPIYTGREQRFGFRLGEMEYDAIYMNNLIIPYWLFTP